MTYIVVVLLVLQPLSMVEFVAFVSKSKAESETVSATPTSLCTCPVIISAMILVSLSLLICCVVARIHMRLWISALLRALWTPTLRYSTVGGTSTGRGCGLPKLCQHLVGQLPQCLYIYIYIYIHTLHTHTQAIPIHDIADKFPERNGGLRDLFEKGPQDRFFLVKFWADINSDLLEESEGAFYGVSSQYESSDNMTISCSTKVCSFGKQVVEKVEVRGRGEEGWCGENGCGCGNSNIALLPGASDCC